MSGSNCFVVLVIFFHVRNYRKVSGFEQHTLIISWFLWVWGPGTVQPGFRVSYKALLQVLPGAGISFEGCQGKDPLPSSCDCWQDLVPWGFLGWGHLVGYQVEVILGSLPRDRCTAAYWIRASSRKAASKVSVTILCNMIAGVTSHYLHQILSVRNKSRILMPTLDGKGYQEAWVIPWVIWASLGLSTMFISPTSQLRT